MLTNVTEILRCEIGINKNTFYICTRENKKVF